MAPRKKPASHDELYPCIFVSMWVGVPFQMPNCLPSVNMVLLSMSASLAECLGALVQRVLALHRHSYALSAVSAPCTVFNIWP